MTAFQSKGQAMRIATPFALLAAALACSLFAEPALAQRVFVSASGNDSNPCSFASPCRSFQHAHDVTSANGEIDVLDPAGYGPLTITKAISIQGHGFSGISVPSGVNGITINAPSTAAVHLNGLLIDGNNVGGAGILFNTGKSLTVENCIVRRSGGGSGLAFRPTGTTKSTLAVSDSYFSDNVSNGLDVEPQSSGPVTAAITRSGFYDNGNINFFVYGANGTGAVNVAVTDSVAANSFSFNGATGFAVSAGSNRSVSNLSLTRCLAVGNSIGVDADSFNATIWLAQSTVTGNGQGFSQSNGGVINTYGDNSIAAGNQGGNGGTITFVGKQ
jgi:hypothetical protein